MKKKLSTINTTRVALRRVPRSGDTRVVVTPRVGVYSLFAFGSASKAALEKMQFHSVDSFVSVRLVGRIPRRVPTRTRTKIPHTESRRDRAR